LPAIDVHLIAQADQEAPLFVIADQRDCLDRKRRAEAAEIDRHVGAAAAALNFFAEAVGGAFLIGPPRDQAVAVDAPRPAANDAAPRHLGSQVLSTGSEILRSSESARTAAMPRF